MQAGHAGSIPVTRSTVCPVQRLWICRCQRSQHCSCPFGALSSGDQRPLLGADGQFLGGGDRRVDGWLAQIGDMKPRRFQGDERRDRTWRARELRSREIHGLLTDARYLGLKLRLSASRSVQRVGPQSPIVRKRPTGPFAFANLRHGRTARNSGLGTLRSEPVFAQVSPAGRFGLVSVFPRPSQNCRLLAVNDGQTAGDDA